MVERSNTVTLLQQKSSAGNSWPSRSSSYKLETVIGMGTFGLVWKAIVQDGEHEG